MREYKEQSDLILQVMKNIPYPDQVSDLDLSFDNAIRFTWRSSRFRFAKTGMVEQVEGHLLSGSNEAILLERILNKL